MKYYFESFGQIYSLNKKDAFNMMCVFYRTGCYDLRKYKSTKAINGKSSYGCFRQGNKLRMITMNLVEYSDNYNDDYDNFYKEIILDHINKLK
jgi:hypothetical protein